MTYSLPESAQNRRTIRKQDRSKARREAAKARKRKSTAKTNSSASEQTIDQPLEWLESLSTTQLEEVVSYALGLIKDRRSGEGDLEALIEKGFAECFTARGEATMPICVNGVVIIPGSVQIKNGKGDHDCNLYTVRIADEDRWSWDFTEHILETQTFRSGNLRKTVTLYPAINNMFIFGHNRKMVNKSNSAYPVHVYKSGGAKPLMLKYDEETGNGKFVIAEAREIRRLPVPTGIEQD